MKGDTPSFGTIIRARRLGWWHAPRHGCFIRMSDAEEMNSFIELCPPNSIPGKSPNKWYRQWWDGGDGVLSLIPWLKGVRAIKKYVCVVVDTNGTIIRSAA